MEGRVCNRCKEFKPWGDFAINKKGKNDRKSICKICSNKSQRVLNKKRYKEDPEKWRERRWEKQLKCSYGLSRDDYEELLQRQNRQCAICYKKVEDIPSKKLWVDHCHNSKEVRGLLCNNCNSGIGYLQDTPEVVYQAYKYLLESKKEKDNG